MGDSVICRVVSGPSSTESVCLLFILESERKNSKVQWWIYTCIKVLL